VIKAYVEKQRQLRNNPMLFSDKADPGSVPIAGFWSRPGSTDRDEPEAANAQSTGHQETIAEDRLQGGTVLLRVAKRTKRRATLAVLGSAGAN
jgi:hypothetical protein